MHRASEQLLEIVLQGGLIEQGPPLVHVDEQIEIAARNCVTAGNGPEDRHRPRAVTCGDVLNVIAASSQLVKGWRRPSRRRIRIRAAAALDLAAKLAEPAQGRITYLRAARSQPAA
jgi:hypothetical protein